MFNQLSKRLQHVVKQLSGQARLTEKNIKSSLREVRMSLLEADVALPVVKAFLRQVEEKALGQEVIAKVNPGQMLIKVVNDELTAFMGQACDDLNLKVAPPAVILMAGLQGSGKTTSVAKLARFLKDKHKKSVLVVSVDVYRPAAITQLEKLAQEIEVECFPSDASQKPIEIATAAIAHAKKHLFDVLLVDTAGRLAINEAMMAEIKQLHEATNPVETLFVVDAMTGQDAANTAKAFNEALPLTGVILTKVDGDARGGAALSIRHVTGKPIKFLGMGEQTDALDPFHPDRIASRILGMGDILSLLEQAEAKLDKSKAEAVAKKITTGKRFDMQDLREQLSQMEKMGGMQSLLDKMPGMGAIPEAAKQQLAQGKQFKSMTAVIDSMTLKERRNPDLLNGSRKKRIAFGSGSSIQQVNKVLKQWRQTSKMMGKMGKGGMPKMLKKMQGLLPGM